MKGKDSLVHMIVHSEEEDREVSIVTGENQTCNRGVGERDSVDWLVMPKSHFQHRSVEGIIVVDLI